MKRDIQTHEDLTRSDAVKTGSNRAFGITFFIVFLILGLLPLLRGHAVHPVLLAIGGGFLAVALVVPAWLAPLNRLWMKFGELLHRIVSPVILGIMFFGVITPIGWLMRFAGKDLLCMKFDRDAETYWIRRVPPGPDKSSLKRQF